MSGRAGRSGGRSKPGPIHLVDGTHQANRHGAAANIAAGARANRAERCPSPPAMLSGPARAEWRRLAPLLHARGLLSARHRGAFAALCRAWGELVIAQRKIESDGRWITTSHNNVIQAPAVGTANRASVEYRNYLIEFGLSPSAEARLTGGGKQDSDPLAEFEREDRKRREAGREPGAK